MKKKNHHPLHHLQTLVNHKPKNMTAVAAIAAHAAIAKNSDNNPACNAGQAAKACTPKTRAQTGYPTNVSMD